ESAKSVSTPTAPPTSPPIKEYFHIVSVALVCIPTIIPDPPCKAAGWAYTSGMPKRSSKPQKDTQQLARSVLDQIAPDADPKSKAKPEPQKNPAAVALGRLGGLKGGKARAAKLSAARRKAIAKQAAKSRWASK